MDAPRLLRACSPAERRARRPPRRKSAQASVGPLSDDLVSFEIAGGRRLRSFPEWRPPVRGQWRYLSRAIDSNGDTVAFWFSERRNLTAKRFLRKALKRRGRPERIVS